MYCYVWEYLVHPDHLNEFETGYGPTGRWVSLFRRDPAYVRTELLRDREDRLHFMTIDYWETRDAWGSFRQRFSAEFEAIDARFESITTRESLVGEFDSLG